MVSICENIVFGRSTIHIGLRIDGKNRRFQFDLPDANLVVGTNRLNLLIIAFWPGVPQKDYFGDR
jgi:hypothetical protein